MTDEEIRELRCKRGWSQQELANRLGINQATVSRLERGVPASKPVAMLLKSLAAEVFPSEPAQ